MSAWTEEQEQTAARMWAAGVATREIGAAVGKSGNAVIGRARDRGWGVHAKAWVKTGSQWTRDRILRLDELRQNGLTAQEIGTVLGVSAIAVKCAASRFRLTRRYRQRDSSAERWA